MNSNKKALPLDVLGVLPESSADSAAGRSRFPRGWLKVFLPLKSLFFWTVVAPTSVVGLYYALFASNIYVSESSFVVQSAEVQDIGGLGAGSLLKLASGNANSDTYNVTEFMQSRDGLRILDKEIGLRQEFGRSRIDPIRRFAGLYFWDRSFEALYRYYYSWVVTITIDSESSISKLEVRAFTPEDARLINERLLELGERLVNSLNNRLQEDMVLFAKSEVETAEQKAKAAFLALSNYRNGNILVDPEHQSSQQLDLTMKLEQELIEAQNLLAQLNGAVADNPQIPVLKNKIKNLESAIKGELAKATGEGATLTNKASEYDRLTFERDFSEKQLADALSFLETARTQAQREQRYLERIVEPSLPDIAVEPWRVLNTLATLVLGVIVWGILSLFVAGVREHQQ